ncbi:maleylacetate reductase [Burkholderia ubonensis]|uniref:maleylacetate reductase n=1 Tax=Burkholderia ubonensis TaxID=101571 RepID=UPI002ABE8545|nr:maleylacetate reductase [Burkholderia ubonensis]
MDSFVYSGLPARIIFGPGSIAELDREIAALGATRAIVLSTPSQHEQADELVRRVGKRVVGVFAGAVQHVPVETASRALEFAASVRADCVIALGGGSTTGLGKAIALGSTLPIIAIPTTYAGSEVTPVYGITEGGVKKTGRDLRVLPKTVVYDPCLTITLPPALSLTSGINAIAHAAEGLYARDANPIVSLMAEEGIHSLTNGIRRVMRAPDDLDARADCLYGAWLCGTVLGSVGMALHHKLCHTLGGMFNLPHAETHTIVLPHVLAYNRDAAPDAMRRIARALNTNDAPRAVYDLARGLGAPVALKEIGMVHADLDAVIDATLASPYWNPRPVERGPLRALLNMAYEGRRPE